MSDVRLTVVMAVRNGQTYLREAVESVLAQTVRDFEFLIIDDASTDDTKQILSTYRRDPRIRVLCNPTNLGIAQSLNRALLEARGDVIARHDADDVSPSNRFAIQLDAFRGRDDVSLVTGRVEMFRDGGSRSPTVIAPPASQPRLEWELLFGNVIGAGAHVMFPRRINGTAVFFPGQFRYAQDYALWWRLCRLGAVACPPDIVYRHRRHESSVSTRWRLEQAECALRIRREYQSTFLGVVPSPHVASEVARFWTTEGQPPEDVVWSLCYSTLIDLRVRFLAYVGERYGGDEKTRLEFELEREIRDRLAHWLFRASRALDVKACGELVSIIEARGELRHISTKALSKAARALINKFPRSADVPVPGRKQPELPIDAADVAFK
jgi:glycosyltransferase involved in cell wall biosynthesis